MYHCGRLNNRPEREVWREELKESMHSYIRFLLGNKGSPQKKEKEKALPKLLPQPNILGRIRRTQEEFC